jgi:hypothetical protein
VDGVEEQERDYGDLARAQADGRDREHQQAWMRQLLIDDFQGTHLAKVPLRPWMCRRRNAMPISVMSAPTRTSVPCQDRARTAGVYWGIH